MNFLIILTFCCLFYMAQACCTGDDHEYSSYAYNEGYYGGDKEARRYGYGFRCVPFGVEAFYNNAARQLRINRIAEHVGGRSSAAHKYSAPGTGNYFPTARYMLWNG